MQASGVSCMENDSGKSISVCV